MTGACSRFRFLSSMVKVEGPVYSFDKLGDRYYVGHGKCSLTCLDNDFNIIWTQEIVREPTYCYWWELDYPTVVALRALEYEGKKYIIAGCGDLFLRCLTDNGKETWRFQYINGVPGRIEIFDINGGRGTGASGWWRSHKQQVPVPCCKPGWKTSV